MDEFELIRQKEIEYCRGHIEYFVQTYCKIEDKDAEELIQPFDMWPMQREALLSIHKHRLNILLKARQLGFTWLALAYCAWLLVLYPGRTVIALSRTEDEAMELVRRLGVMFQNMPLMHDKKTAGHGASFDKSAMKIEISYPDGPNSIFKAFPSSPGAARSFTADILLFDEWAFQQFDREIWLSAFPVINRPFGGKVIGISTIQRGSLFEEIYTDNDNSFNKIFIPWNADPKRDEKWYKETKKNLGELITQEYPATVDEALTVPGGSFFPEVSRETHETDDFTDGRRYVSLDYGLDMLSVHWWTIDTAGNSLCYREYDSPNKTIGESCDIIISLTGDEKIDLYLAPPDLWNRSQESGKSRAILFSEGGLELTKSSNDFKAGCAAMKECLKVKNDRPKLQILAGKAPNLYRCLTKIQKDEKKPDVYAKEPHELTHDVDSMRYFCVYWTSAAVTNNKKGNKKRWRSDLLEDYDNADKEMRQLMVKKYGEPVR